MHTDDVVAAAVHGNGPEKVAGLRVRQVKEADTPGYEVQPRLMPFTVIVPASRPAWLTVSSESPPGGCSNVEVPPNLRMMLPPFIQYTAPLFRIRGLPKKRAEVVK